MAEIGKQRTIWRVQEGFDRGKDILIDAYRRQEKYNPVIAKAGGVELVVRLTIDESGAVTDCAVVSDTANDATFEAAMLDAIRKVHFSPHPGPPSTVERYPIMFHPM